MKISYLFKILSVLCLILGQNVLGQNGNPSVAAAVRFEEHPIDLSRGLPQVNIPIYSLPTRSKEISINTSLNYHPTSIAAFMERAGNCGGGWYLSSGAAISKKDLDGSYFNFNFMGFTGKLVAYVLEGQITAYIIENSGENLVVTGELDATNTKIAALNFYDDKGYRYRFADSDITYKKREDNGVYTPRISAYQITSIHDNNGNILANYNYQIYNQSFMDGTTERFHNYKMLTEVSSPGYGKLEFNNEFHTSEDLLWSTCKGVTLKNSFNAIIKKFDFDLTLNYDGLIIKNIRLNQVTETGPAGENPQVYKLYYRPVAAVADNVQTVDPFGYYSNIYKWCKNLFAQDFVDQNRVMGGVLEKMTLPAGGCVIYNYESGTYSFGDKGKPLDLKSDNTVDANYFTNLDARENLHNFNKTVIASSTTIQTSAPLSFTLTQPTQVYFKIDAEQFYSNPPSGIGVFKYPEFTLNKSGTSQYLYRFNVQGDTFNPDDFDLNYSNGENNCLGYSRLLEAGTYTINMLGGVNGKAEVYRLALVSPVFVKKWYYGGGVRIKSIAYFDSSDIPQNYFDLGASAPPSQKRINYSYNLFTDLTRSSGFGMADGSDRVNAIGYRNVTVSGSSDGKTEYTFYFPQDFLDYPTNQEFSYDYRVGKLKTKKVYNAQNVVQLESEYQYNYSPLLSGAPAPNVESTGWVTPLQILNKEYFPEGTLQTKDVFTYYTNRKLKDKTTTTSRSSESLITKYYYHVGNSIHSQNRIGELDYVEEFLGTNLLSTTKFEYSNVWKNNAGTTINVAYLPQQIKSSKGSGALEIRSKINRYDQYGNVLETEQQNGIKKSFIWGYNGTLIIAEIDNMAYSDIPETLITNAQVQSLNVNQPNLFLAALINLRNASQLADAFITTYTYKPLVGVSSMTDPRGYETTYLYDTSNRLIEVRDHAGNIITKNTYNTKPQN